jgi:hypothetical protein
MLLSFLPVRLFPLCFFLRCRGNARNMRIDGFADSFVSPKKKRREQKIFMFEKIDSLFVVVVAIALLLP